MEPPPLHFHFKKKFNIDYQSNQQWLLNKLTKKEFNFIQKNSACENNSYKKNTYMS